MEDTRTYGIIINEKLREFDFPDMEETWPDMMNILDREMPQTKRRRFAFWFTRNRSFVIGALAISISVLALVVLNQTKENTPGTTKEPGKTPAHSNKQTKLPGESLNTEAVIAPLSNTTVNTSKQTATEDHHQKAINPAGKESKVIANTNHIPGKQQQTAIVKEIPVKIEKIAEKEITANTLAGHKASTTRDIVKNDKQNIENTIAIPANQETELKKTKHVAQNKEAPLPLNANNGQNKNTQQQTNHQVFITKVKAEPVEIKTPVTMQVQVLPVLDKKITPAKDLITLKDVAETQTADSNLMKVTKRTSKGKGWVIGASVNYHMPVSNQEMSTVNINGKKNTLIDFIPSVYAQYHFNKKWYLESAFQFSSPQYITNHKLAASYKDLSSIKKEENAVWLNKLYYINVPVSLHYRITPRITIGTGLQYSYLKRSIMADELAIWENGPNGWQKTASEKTIKVKSNSDVKKAKNDHGNNGNGGNGNGNGGNGNGGNGNGGNGNGGNGNGNGGNGNGGNGNGGNGNGGNGNGGNGGTSPTPATLTQADTAAMSLRSSDLRFLLDVNYNWRRFNIGARYNMGLNNYINTTSGNSLLAVKDRNQAFQLYFRYDLFDRRRKK